MNDISREWLNKLGFSEAEYIDKGWSCDKKFRVKKADGTSFLLRITPKEKSANRAEMFRMQKKAAELGIPMCQPLDFGECAEGVYSVQSWIDGEDAREGISVSLF